MLIKLIEKQGNKYRLKIDGAEVLFIPLDLFTTRFTSYKQIKNAIKNNKNT